MSLGKRKRRDQLNHDDISESSGTKATISELRARFQEHFEAKFEPLERISFPSRDTQSSESRSEDSEPDWNGLSDVDDKEGPEIIQHHKVHSAEAEIPNGELKMFMV